MKSHRYQVLMCLLLTLACSLRAADTVYVGVGYGLLRSTDAGATWEMVNVPLNTPFMKGYVRPGFLAMDPHNTSKIYFIGFAGAASSFFASADAGASWTVTPFIGLQPSHLAVDFADQAIYISASPNRGSTFLYKSTDTGATWTQLPLPATAAEPSGATVGRIFADPTVSGTVYVLTDNGTYFFKSTDFGSTWTQVAQAHKDSPSYVDPHNSLIWYDVTGGRVGSNLLKSTDGASSFTQLNIPTDNVDSVSVGAVSSTVYAAGDVSGVGESVLKSTDGGASWKVLDNGLFTFGVVWADPVDASLVFTNDYINPGSFSVSTDGGAHFNPSVLPEGPPDCVPGNCARPEVSDLLFAASIPSPPVITVRGEWRELSGGSGGQFLGHPPGHRPRSQDRRLEQFNCQRSLAHFARRSEGYDGWEAGVRLLHIVWPTERAGARRPRRSDHRDRDDAEWHECKLRDHGESLRSGIFPLAR